MKFRYCACDGAGQSLADVIEASTREEAIELLRGRGLFTSEISSAESAGTTQRRGLRWGRGGRLKHLADFSRHLQILVSSGTPLTESLVVVERQMTHPGWRVVLGQVRAKVEAGGALSTALAEHPDYFDAICRSLVAAGEASGELPSMLDRLATLSRKQVKVRNIVVGALIYPVLLCAVGLAVLITLFIFVLPRFAELFKSLDVPLPPTTAFLMGLGHFVQSYWWLVLGGGAALVFGMRRWLASEQGKRNFEQWLLCVPRLGLLLRNLATARLARLLGILLESHVPLLESLALVKQAAGNVCYQELIGRAEDAVTRGESMSTVFVGSPLVNPSVAEGIRNGERTGKLSTLLLHVSDFLDEENDLILRSLASIIEPAILIVMGALVGFIAVSMFLPLFDLVGMAQGGRR